MLTLGVASASDFTQNDEIATVNDNFSFVDDSADVLCDNSYYDEDFSVYVHEDYNYGKWDWDKAALIDMHSYCQKNGTFTISVDNIDKLNVPLTDGYFSVEEDENGTYYIRSKYICPDDLALDYGEYDIKVTFEGNTLVDDKVTLNEKEDFEIYLLNPYYCEQDYWNVPSFIIIDSNNMKNGTLEVSVNGTRKMSYNVVNGCFEEIADCSNRSRYLSASDLLDDYGTYNIKITFNENGTDIVLKDENVLVAEFEPTVNPKLELGFYSYVQYLRNDNIAYIYLPREAKGKLTLSYNDHVFDVPYSRGYAEHMINAWNVQYLGETTFTATYVGDDFGTLTTTETIIVTPTVKAPAYVSLGEEFSFSMVTHEWVNNGKFDVYDYTGDVKGKLIASEVINGGISSVKLSSNKVGLNKFYLEFDTGGSGKYHSIQEVHVIKNSENITVNIPAKVQEDQDFNVTVNAPASPYTFAYISVDGGNANYYSMENGTVIETLHGLSSGNHTVSVQYNNGYYENGNWVGDIYSNTFTVTSYPFVRIDAKDVIKYYSGSQRFVVKVYDKNNSPLKNATVKIKINGKTYDRTTDDNGQASIALGLNSGEYNVTSECGEFKAESTVTIKETVTANDFTKMYRNATQYEGVFLDSNGKPLAQGTQVEFNINGVFYKRNTDNKGIARMNINLNPGKYILTAKNPGTGENHRTNITVLPTITENYDLTKYYKNDSQYRVRLLDDKGNPVGKGVSIEFNINGVFYTRVSDENGYVKMNINLVPGTYIITARYNGLMASNIITVKPILTASDVSMKYRDGTQFKAKLVDGTGRPYANQNITFNINGVFYNKITNENGIASLSINLMAGKYIITSMYGNGASASNTITIS